MVNTLGGVFDVEAGEHRVTLDPSVIATLPGDNAPCSTFVKSPASCSSYEHARFLSNTYRSHLLVCHEKRRNL